MSDEHTRHQIAQLLREALARVEHEHGFGGAYWRLAKALRWIDAHLEATETAEHAAFVRDTHGRIE